MVQEKAASDGGKGGKVQLSSGQEAAFKWLMGLFTSTLHYAATEAVTLKSQLLEIVAKLFSLSEGTKSLAMGEGASQMLSSLLATLVSYYPKDEYAAQAPAEWLAAAGATGLHNMSCVVRSGGVWTDKGLRWLVARQVKRAKTTDIAPHTHERQTHCALS
jgi:hypothetical protein